MGKHQVFQFVGHVDAWPKGEPNPYRHRAVCQQQVGEWIARQKFPPQADGTVILTYIIDLHTELWLASRNSEHVACAVGEPVLAAGELTLKLSNDPPCGKPSHPGYAQQWRIEVVGVSNHSTGYLPEPDCWPVVAEALDRMDILRPDQWTVALVLRRCPVCQWVNVIKDDHFFCDICQRQLPQSPR